MGYTPPFLDVRKVSGGWTVYGPSSATSDDLTIYPNTTDATPRIVLNGAQSLQIYVPGGQYFRIMDVTAGEILRVSYATPDVIIDPIIANKNVFINPNGTGLLKFGTYTAGAATDSTGYITILDAAGNTRKLMVQA